MYWKLITHRQDRGVEERSPARAKRFVLQRHTDALGPHLDLRLEQDGFLVGFRIDGLSIEGEAWATEKAPHPVEWLEHDGETCREDAGVYELKRLNDTALKLRLHAPQRVYCIDAVSEAGLPPTVVRDICGTLRAHDAVAEDAAKLIADGLAARRRAMGRLCGLARELDGAAFDEEVCRRAFAVLSLEDIHTQLRAYEVRFDAKYPPAPVTQPENMRGRDRIAAHSAALEIARA